MLTYFQYGFSDAGWAYLARLSARLTLAVFTIVFLLSNHRGNIPERLLGQPLIFLALADTIYVLEKTVVLSHSQTSIFFVAVFIALHLGIVISPFIHHSVTAKYPWIPIIYLYYCWFGFFVTFWLQVKGYIVSESDPFIESVALLGWCSLLLGMKVTAVFTRRSRR